MESSIWSNAFRELLNIRRIFKYEKELGKTGDRELLKTIRRR